MTKSRRDCKHKRVSMIYFLVTTIAGLLLLSLPLLANVLAQANATIVSTNVYFGFSIYETYVNFNSEQRLVTLSRENNYWYFNGYGFQTEIANMTITNFFENDHLNFMLDAQSGNISITRIYVGNRARPNTVEGATSWDYNDGTRILTIVVVHTSPQEVEVSWLETASLGMLAIYAAFLPLSGTIFGLSFVVLFFVLASFKYGGTTTEESLSIILYPLFAIIVVGMIAVMLGILGTMGL